MKIFLDSLPMIMTVGSKPERYNMKILRNKWKHFRKTSLV